MAFQFGPWRVYWRLRTPGDYSVRWLTIISVTTAGKIEAWSMLIALCLSYQTNRGIVRSTVVRRDQRISTWRFPGIRNGRNSPRARKVWITGSSISLAFLFLRSRKSYLPIRLCTYLASAKYACVRYARRNQSVGNERSGRGLRTISLSVITNIFLLFRNPISQDLAIERAISFSLIRLPPPLVFELLIKNFWTQALGIIVVGIHKVVQVSDFVEEGSGSIVPVFQIVLLGFALGPRNCFRQRSEVEEFIAKGNTAVPLLWFAEGL